MQLREVHLKQHVTRQLPERMRRARTVERTPSGGFFATAAANSRAQAAIQVPRGATRSMMLAASASSAVKKRPVKADIGGEGARTAEVQQRPVFGA